MVIARQMWNTPISNASTIWRAYVEPPTWMLPVSITDFRASGIQDTSVRFTPKAVPRKKPTMVVDIPSTEMSFPSPSNMLIFTIFLSWRMP